MSNIADIVEIVDEPDLNYNVTGEVVIIQDATVNSNSNISIDACGPVIDELKSTGLLIY